MRDKEHLQNMSDFLSSYRMHPLHVEMKGDYSEFLKPLPALEELGLQPHPYMILRATAMPYVSDVRDMLRENSIMVKDEAEIDKFELFARYLYPIDMNNEETYMWFLLARAATPLHYNWGHAFILDPQHIENYSHVDTVKRIIRNNLGPAPFVATYNDRRILTSLHHIHGPDVQDIHPEYNLLMHFILNTTSVQNL